MKTSHSEAKKSLLH